MLTVEGEPLPEAALLEVLRDTRHPEHLSFIRTGQGLFFRRAFSDIECIKGRCVSLYIQAAYKSVCYGNSQIQPDEINNSPLN